ncbi:MAG TPA: ATP-binding protein [Anaerolineaceae bacterium]
MIQLYKNPIGNAIIFHGNPPPQATINVKQKQSRWMIRIQDNGIGIAPKYHERIFEIFQRLHGRSAYPRTGIGLAMCKNIVNRHGGDIWVESEEEHGSTFLFTIPILPGEQFYPQST